MKRVLILLTLGFLIASLFLTGCGGKEIKVGSKMDPESLLLAQMMIMLLSENGYHVIDKTPTGNTYDLIDAIKNKDIDICPEYTGNIGEYVDDAKVEWLKPGPADNKWGIAVPASMLTPDNRTLSYFFDAITTEAGMASIKIICSYEFTVNDNALKFFENTYNNGNKLDPSKLLIIPGSNTEQMAEQAAKRGWAAMAFTTDGHLDRHNMELLLEDNNKPQKVFHPAPVVQNGIYEKIHREDLNRILTPLFASLNNDTLKKLNSQIGLRGSQAISDVARQYLIENGYFRYDERQMVQDAVDEMIRRNDGSIPPGLEKNPTNIMADFPNESYRIYFGEGSIRGEKYEYQNGEDTLEGYRLNWFADPSIKPEKEKPKYAEEEDINNEEEQWLGSPLTIRETRGTYSCDENGIVTQESTGW